MRDVENKIKDAIEASYYVSPDEPGLRRDELLALLAKFGIARGEVETTLRRLDHEVVGTLRGYRFLPEKEPLWMTDVLGMTWNGDPRDRAIIDYLHQLIRERARKDGIDKPLFQHAAVIAQGVEDGHEERDMRLAFRCLVHLKLARIDDQTHEVYGTERMLGTGWAKIATETHGLFGYGKSRDDFAELQEAVQMAIDARSPSVRRAAMLAALAGLPKIALAGEERQVLDDVLAYFADRGEGRSLDDTRRRMRTLDVHAVAHVQLAHKHLLHSRNDSTVIPSLLAIGQHPTLFVPLLLLLDDVLARAEKFWDEKQMRPPLKGVSGLVWVAKEQKTADTEEAMRQFELLLDALSFTPALAPGSPSVEIRNDIVALNTGAKLLKRKHEELEAMRERVAITEAPVVTTKQPSTSKPRVPKGKALELLRRAAAQARAFEDRQQVSDTELDTWIENTRTYLRRIFGEASAHYERFAGISYVDEFGPDHAYYARCEGLNAAGHVLDAFVHELEVFDDEGDAAAPAQLPPVDILVNLFRTFPRATHHLRERGRGRAPLVMDDEYDVQYLLHALMLVHFQVIKPEEPTPSHAGAWARMDFFLPRERVMIEVKMTRKDLADAALGQELTLDVRRYEKRTDCDVLVIFIYDPDKRIKNPSALVSDVEGAPTLLKTIRVIVAH